MVEKEIFERRLEEVYKELSGEILRVKEILYSEELDTISNRQKELLKEQLVHMVKYENVLRLRLDDLNIELI